MIKKELTQEEKDRQISSLVASLSRLNEFKSWRDYVVKPNIEALEKQNATGDNLSEVVLRANLKHIASLKYLFYEVFEQAKQNEED